jgi:hypothetical protein
MYFRIYVLTLAVMAPVLDRSTLDCEAGLDQPLSQPVVALRCADRFIKENGYTTAPPTSDESRLVSESLEHGSTWAEVLSYRRGTLVAGSGSAFCGELWDGRDGCMVSYERTGTRGCRLRAVLMTPDYRELRVMHQDLRPDPVPSHCEGT